MNDSIYPAQEREGGKKQQDRKTENTMDTKQEVGLCGSNFSRGRRREHGAQSVLHTEAPNVNTEDYTFIYFILTRVVM